MALRAERRCCRLVPDQKRPAPSHCLARRKQVTRLYIFPLWTLPHRYPQGTAQIFLRGRPPPPHFLRPSCPQPGTLQASGWNLQMAVSCPQATAGPDSSLPVCFPGKQAQVRGTQGGAGGRCRAEQGSSRASFLLQCCGFCPNEAQEPDSFSAEQEAGIESTQKDRGVASLNQQGGQTCPKGGRQPLQAQLTSQRPG